MRLSLRRAALIIVILFALMFIFNFLNLEKETKMASAAQARNPFLADRLEAHDATNSHIHKRQPHHRHGKANNGKDNHNIHEKEPEARPVVKDSARAPRQRPNKIVVDAPLQAIKPNPVPTKQARKAIPGEQLCNAPTMLVKADIEVDALIDNCGFKDQDGGVWKQGFPISYDANSWTQSKKLRIFVVPHSHNDPGWLKTVDQYFQEQTNKILTGMINALSENIERKFIWAEISYFSMWWDSTTPDMHNKVKTLLANKQFEFVTGGWVIQPLSRYCNHFPGTATPFQVLQPFPGTATGYGTLTCLPGHERRSEHALLCNAGPADSGPSVAAGAFGAGC